MVVRKVVEYDVGNSWVRGVAPGWFGKGGGLEGGEFWGGGIRPQSKGNDGKFVDDQWDWNGVAGSLPKSWGELGSHIKIVEEHGVGEALKAKDFPG